MKISGLIFDLDGTAIPNQQDGMPSRKVVDAVEKAKRHCLVTVATGRSFEEGQTVLEALDIQELCILSGGSQLYYPPTKEYLWKQELDTVTLQQIIYKLKKDFGQYSVADNTDLNATLLKDYLGKEGVSVVWIAATSRDDSEKIIKICRQFPDITAHSVPSWVQGAFDVHISHELATKKHALQSLMSRLNLKTDELMVVGDGGNDLPLFELAGLKIAMGNAAPELKAAADWIAPRVEVDGLAVAIEKFIL